MNENTATNSPAAPALTAIERRVVGALVEKAFTTPDSYPLTTNSVITACNQKSARDPASNHQAHEVDEALIDLKGKGLVIQVFAETGRTARWKHNLREAWQMERPQLAVLAELFLRGPQTEGDLRSRASRMATLATLEDLRSILDGLATRGFVRRLSPEVRKRGVMWGHLCLTDREKGELDRIAEREAAMGDGEEPSGGGGGTTRGSDLREAVERIEGQLADVMAKLAALEQAIGKSES